MAGDEKDQGEDQGPEMVTVKLDHTIALGAGHSVNDPNLYGPGEAVKMPRATADAMGLKYEGSTRATAGEGTDYKSMTKDDLQAEVDKRGLEVEDGSGSGGAILKDDLIAALEADDEESGGSE